MSTLPSRLGLNTSASCSVYLAVKTRPQDRHATTTSKPGNKVTIAAKSEVTQYAETTFVDGNKTADQAAGANEPTDGGTKTDNGLTAAGTSRDGENTKDTKTEDAKPGPAFLHVYHLTVPYIDLQLRENIVHRKR